MAMAYFRGPTRTARSAPLKSEKEYQEFMKSPAVREQIILGREARKAARKARKAKAREKVA
jgi:hypothetical protein